MSYVVFENHGSLKYTRIHGAGCRYVKPPGTRTQNTGWHPLDGGTFATLDEAQAGMEHQTS